MTDSLTKLQELKQSVRSILLPERNGSTIPDFLKNYRAMLGENVPFREFGYNSFDHFIRSLTDVVSVTWSSMKSAYVLKAIADESTKHIEKLVSKQKSSKTRGSLRRPNSGSGMAPRFKYSTNSWTNFNQAHLPVNVKKEIVEVVEKYADGLSISNFLTAYRRQFGKVINFANYGYNTPRDCLNTIPELVVKDQNNETRVYPIHTVVRQEGLRKIQVEAFGLNTRSINMEGKTIPNRCTIPGTINMKKEITSQNIDTTGRPAISKVNPSVKSSAIDNVMKTRFQKIMKDFPSGIFASKFVKIYEHECGGCKLNLSELGYLNLVDLLESMPDVFIIKRPPGCFDDWLLIDAGSPVKNVTSNESNGSGFNYRQPNVENGFNNRQPTAESDVPDVIKNIRYLLKNRTDGIYMDDFLDSYRVMHKESLDVQEFGFDSLQTFLETIDSTVPLILENSKETLGKTQIHYVYQNNPNPASQILKSYVPPEIPSDAVLSAEKYHYQTLPSNVDLDQYIGVFVINVETPEMMHIQFYREDTAIALERLMDKLEGFYFGERSLEYEMPESYVVRGAACAAIWPGDGHWHRTLIISVPNPDSIFVEYVDYGTRQKIPKKNLRFLKKEYMTLPAQAVNARLNFIMPINGSSWGPGVQKRILELTKEKPLMALIDDKSFRGYLSLSLCDTTGSEDVHINDVLVKEGFAQYCIYKDGIQIPISSLGGGQSPDQNHFAYKNEVAADCNEGLLNGFRRNDSVGNILNKSVSVDGCSSEVNALNVEQLITSNIDPSIMHRFLYPTTDPYGNDDSSVHLPNSDMNYSVLENREEIKSITKADGNLKQGDSIYSDISSDIFQDEEEVYEKICLEVNLPVKRQVKKISLSDGFPEVHLVVVERRPFISSGDLTCLLWQSDDPDYVERRLRMKDISIPMTTLHEIGNEQLFIQLKRQRVRGIKAEDIYNPSITFFPFKNVIDILNIFGHPSVAVRVEIENEMQRFDPDDPFWKVASENEIAETQVVRETDNDKQQRVCLFDLKSSLQALKFKKQKLKNEQSLSRNNPDASAELRKIEMRCAEIESQIDKLQQKVVSYSVNKQN